MAVDRTSPPVVVTGATGWLGRRLVQVLLDGLAGDERFQRPAPDVDVRCLVLPTDEGSVPTGVKVIRGDLRESEACKRLFAHTAGGILFHTAAVIHPDRSQHFIDVNVTGTKNVLAAAAAAGVRRAIVVSSSAPVGCNQTRDERFDESSPYHPYMGYGRSKMVMEQHVAEVQRAGRLETVVIRAPWFYGPEQPARQTLFFEMIRAGTVPIVGDGNNRRSMAYVDNLCQGLLLAASREQANGRLYWIADERPYTMNEIVDTVERVLERDFEIPCARRRIRLPNLASDVAQALDRAIQAGGGYHQKIHVLSEMNQTIACSVDEAKRELGYRPAVELEEGMRRSIAWCLEQGLLRAAPRSATARSVRSAPAARGSSRRQLDRALVEALLPLDEIPPEHHHAVVEQVTSFVRGQLDALPPRLSMLMMAALEGFRVATRVRFLRSFSALPQPTRRRWVQQWAYGRLSLGRHLFRAFRSTSLVAYYELPQVRDMAKSTAPVEAAERAARA